MSAKQQSILANLGLLLAAAIWGGGFLAGKFALAEYEPFTILAFRFLGSALCLGLIFCRSLRHTTKNVAKKGMLLGILQFVGLSVQLAGLDHTTPGKQSFLIASYVMFVPFLSCFLLRKRINGRELLAAILTLAGIGCISLNESLTIGLGEGLSVGFAFLFALQIVLVSIFARNEDPIRLSFFQFLSAGLLAAVTALLTDGIPQSCSLLTLGACYTSLCQTPFWHLPSRMWHSVIPQKRQLLFCFRWNLCSDFFSPYGFWKNLSLQKWCWAVF